ncbi:MAG: chemotaxis protein CheW [Methanolobus sp.]
MTSALISVQEVDEHSRIIVVEIGDNVVGMIVDSVNEVLRIPSSSVDLPRSLLCRK